MVERRREARGEASVESCVRGYTLDPLQVNISSVLSLAFVECYQRALESRGPPEDYIPDFTRAFVSRFEEGRVYSCDRVRGLLSRLSAELDEIARGLEWGYYVFSINMTTITRLLVHTRNPYIPFEVSIAWDPIRNVPYIPASTLKGASRHYFERMGIEVDGCAPYDLFGYTESEGLVVFTDAYPVFCGRALVEAEVMAPHYSEVEGNIDEASASPVPLVFLAVPPQVTFRAIVAIRRREGKGCSTKPDTALKIVERISEALTQGVGAKTSVGYGRLRVTYGARSKLESQSST